MCAKRSSNYTFENKAKRSRNGNSSVKYFYDMLKECGLELNPPPEECIALQETAFIISKLKKHLMEHEDYVQNTKKFIDGFKYECNEPEKFKHYILPTVIQSNCSDDYESVIKILLNITTLQSELIEYIFNKILDLLHRPEYDQMVKNVLRVFSSVDTVEHNKILAKKLIELIETPVDNKPVKQEVLLAIPDIIVEYEHDKIAFKLLTILSTNEPLIQYILDCFTYLCLSDVKFEDLHKKTLETMQLMNEAYFCHFIKFLLAPGRLSANRYEETITNLRNNLQMVTIFDFESSNQVLTAKAIRYSMISSKVIAKAWLKVVSNGENAHHKPIDIILFLILYSISDEMQKEVEKRMRIQIKSRRLKEDLLEVAFKSFKPTLSSNLGNLICLSNALLKINTEPIVQSFASRMYLIMFSELEDCSRVIIAGLLRLIINCKQSILIALGILNNIASENWTRLMSQPEPILTLLEEMDDVTLTELKAIMNLVCRLAYSYPNSMIRNKVDISFRKQLGSSIPSTKIRGILTGVYAVKYLMKNNKDFGDARDTIEGINQSTKHYPDMTVFFYHELSEIMQTATNMDSSFREWLVEELSKKWKENFLENTNYNNTIGEVRLTQLSLDENFRDDTQRVVNIANLTLEHAKDKNIVILSPLFRLIGLLHCRSESGDLSSIREVLDYVIIMPAVNVNSIDDLRDCSAVKMLDCCIHCVNFIHEILNIFGTQKNETLKPKIFKRIHQLREQEIIMNKILLIKDIQYKPPAYYPHAVDILNEKVERRVIKSQAKKGKKVEQSNSSFIENSKTQQTNIVTTLKNAYITNIHFRPLNVSLLELLQHDLKLFDAPKTELTVEIVSYLLNHLIGTLEKFLLPRIKRKTFLDKDNVELYSSSDAEIQAKIVNGILSQLMVHVEVIVKFLDCNIEDGTVDFDSENALQIMESFLCLQRIYDLLSIYFKWFEFKERQVLLLKTSLKTIANVTNDTSTCTQYLVTTVMKKFQKHDKYCITPSSAVSLIKLMWALKEHCTGSGETLMVKEMAHNFLSKQFNAIDDELEKGPIYNQHITILTKMYFANTKLIDLKCFVKSLVNDVDKLRDSTSVLAMLKNINKSNFFILFKELGLALYDKIKAFLKANDEVLDNWGTVAIILKFMSEIVTILNMKNLISFYSKIFNLILKIFNTKGFSVLKTHFQQNRELIEKMLKDFNTSMERLKSTSQSSYSILMKNTPNLRANLTCLSYKTKELLGESMEQNSRKKNKKTQRRTAYAADESNEDSDDDLPDDVDSPIFDDSASEISEIERQSEYL